MPTVAVHHDAHPYPEALDSLENRFPALQEVDIRFYSGADCPRSAGLSFYNYQIKF